MKTTNKIKDVKNIIKKIKNSNQTIGFVPTMGYFHDGHLELMRRAKRETDFVVVSIYVNPIQFGKGEDFDKYPRNLQRDIKLAKKVGVDLVFAPDDSEMYPKSEINGDNFSTYVEVKGNLTKTLEGKFRPGHFRGVATVVAKLFNIVEPDIAYFGQKDYQQLLVIKKMVQDLNYNIKIIDVPTCREKDGLAMSSRNKYLSQEERKKATCIYKALMHANDLIEKGERNAYNIIKEMKRIIQSDTSKIDYISIVCADTLKNLKVLKGKILVAVAVWIGKTRLIDNIVKEV